MNVSPALKQAGASALLLAACAAPAWSQTAAERVAKGDQLYAARQLEAAVAEYELAAKAEPALLAASNRRVRALSEWGSLESGEKQRRIWSQAVEIARVAVKSHPDSGSAHLWLAVSLGRLALKEGPKTRLALSREIKSEVDRALQQDPGLGRAYHVRAMWNVRLASLSAIERMAANTVLGGVPKGASFANAEADLRKAIELEPEYVNHRLEYGRLLRELKRPADAKRELTAATTLPPTSSALDERYQTQARELLAKLK